MFAPFDRTVAPWLSDTDCRTIHDEVVRGVERDYRPQLAHHAEIIVTRLGNGITVYHRSERRISRCDLSCRSYQGIGLVGRSCSNPLYPVGVLLALARMDFLTSIDFDFTTDIASTPEFAHTMRVISQCATLRSVEIELRDGDEADTIYCDPIHQLFSASNVHSVGLRVRCPIDRCLATLCESCTSLRHLMLRMRAASIVSLTPFVHNTTIRDLSFVEMGSHIQWIGANLSDIVANNTTLRRLSLEGIRDNAFNQMAFITAMRHNTTLQWLNIGSCIPDAADITAFTRMYTSKPQLVYAGIGEVHTSSNIRFNKRDEYIDRLVMRTMPPNRPHLYSDNTRLVAHILLLLCETQYTDCVIKCLPIELLYYLMDSVYFQTDHLFYECKNIVPIKLCCDI